MNLDQIATKCFILALFIRDDGQRLLLGDGYYDFNQKLQHFQSNTIANDVVEIQGDNGQLLAGQVMRSGAQKFEGYIGDATTNRQIIEQKRSDFMAFFRIKHFYKVIYIFPDGTAIQRQRGYLTDAPTIPEIFQKFPEYSVALNFEDANYYEYAEDEHGDEIYAHIVELALAGGATGGLIWDAIGAVTNGITWSGIQTAQGEYIQVTNELDIPAKLASVEMLGKATQAGTPTPTSPQPISVVTGENVAKIEGKNLFDYASASDTANTIVSSYRIFEIDGLKPGVLYTMSNMSFTAPISGTYIYFWGIPQYPGTPGAIITDGGQYNNTKQYCANSEGKIYLAIYPSDTTTWNNSIRYFENAMLVEGTETPAYEPYQGQEFEVNLGKNLFDKATALSYKWLNASTGEVINSNDPNVVGNIIHVKVGETYVISGIGSLQLNLFSYTNSSGAGGVRRIANSTSVRTYTAQTEWCRFSIGGGDAVSIMDDIQFELGSQATSYASYFTPIELAKIGNYQDRIYKDSGKWYIEKQVGKVVLDGTNATFTSANNGFMILYNSTVSPFYDQIALGRPSYQSMCDHFTVQPNGTTWVGRGMCGFNSSGVFWCMHTDTSITTVAQFNTWLASNPTTVYYALATPTTTEITNEALIAQLNALGASSLFVGVNNIGTETQNAMPTLKIEYYTEYTLDGAGYEWEPGGNTAKTIVTVAGVDSAWPIWTVQGGAQNPTLTNITTGQTISWQGFVPEGQTLTINMAEMTADLAGANVFEYITGEWLRLAPGNNTLVYNAGNADKPSTLSWNGVLA